MLEQWPFKSYIININCQSRELTTSISCSRVNERINICFGSILSFNHPSCTIDFIVPFVFFPSVLSFVFHYAYPTDKQRSVTKQRQFFFFFFQTDERVQQHLLCIDSKPLIKEFNTYFVWIRNQNRRNLVCSFSRILSH